MLEAVTAELTRGAGRLGTGKRVVRERNGSMRCTAPCGDWEGRIVDSSGPLIASLGPGASVTIDAVEHHHLPDEPRPGDAAPFRVLRLLDLDYPVGFRALAHPPDPIFIAGSMTQQDRVAVAVVGSRRASPAAERHAFNIGRELAEDGVTVVSGLARGVDAAAHRGALSVPGGRTIAVVATGLDVTFPSENIALDQLIRRRGAVISPFVIGVGPARTNFLARNALVVGLAAASVIVVADEHSGTSNTISHTLAQGKPVVFWEPTMGDAVWARALADRGQACFARDVDQLLQRIEGGRDDWTQGTLSR